MNAYDLCTLLIKLGVSGMQNRLNVFYGVGQLTDEQYIELTNTLTPKTDGGTTADAAADSKTTTTTTTATDSTTDSKTTAQ